MRILRISHSAAVDAWRERERELRRRGHAVRLVVARAWEAGGRRVRLVPRTTAEGAAEDVVGVRTFGRHPALFLYDPVGLWRELGRAHDVLDIHEEPFALATLEVLALRALRRSRAPFVLYSAQNIAKRYPVPFRWAERWALRAASAVVTCNEGAARIVRAKGLRGAAVVVPLGVDLAAAPRTDGAAAQVPGDVVPGVVRVGYAGRLEEHKGVRVLLDAVAGDERLHLRLAGDGSLRAEVEARAAALGGRVEVLGGLPAEELPAFYASVDVLAVPSLVTAGWVEQFGRVAVEAMACGTPVVATSTGALPDVVGGAGLLVPPDDAAALRTALLAAGTDRDLAARLRTAGLERARECSWPEVAARYERVYEDVLAAAPGAPAATPVVADPDARDVEVVVVAYGRPDLLTRALAPLAGRLPVTVVDNSSDDAVRAVTLEHGARYLDPQANGGFAAGVAFGLAHRRLPHADVLLLNPDAVVDPQDVRALSAALAADPGLASVGPAQADDDGRPARVAWPFPTPGRAWLEAVGLGRLDRRDDYVIGSVLLLRAEALAEVGGLDDGYFLYAEETDWARRAADAGWRHAVVPDAHAVHAGGATSSDPRVRDRRFHASLERYFRAHHGAAGWQSARAAMLLGAALRAPLPGARGSAARRRVALLVGRAGVRG